MKRIHKRCAVCRVLRTVEEPSDEHTETLTAFVCDDFVCNAVLARYRAHSPKMSLYAFYRQHMEAMTA